MAAEVVLGEIEVIGAMLPDWSNWFQMGIFPFSNQEENRVKAKPSMRMIITRWKLSFLKGKTSGRSGAE